MCILALVTHYSARFPFLIITNRDEALDRLTHPLAVDTTTGLLWAVDGVAGGSWLGMELKHGRLATVTNCRRAPTAPLRFRSAADEASWRQRYPRLFDIRSHGADAWRGAAPLSDTLAYTQRVPVHAGPTSGGAAAQRRTLVYEPPTSRGTIIKEYLMDGRLPGEAMHAEGDADLPPSLRPPYYAGYNLVTCSSLFGDRDGDDEPFTAKYTTNRFSAENGVPLAHGEVHCLQNSFLDNWTEPKSTRLRTLFQSALHSTLDPLQARGEPPLSAVEAQRVASALADTCLCDVPKFDLQEMLRDNAAATATSAATPTSSMTLKELLSSTDPRAGFTAEELQQYFSDSAESPVTDDDAVEKECYLQRNIFVKPRGGYGTRVQSVVLTERCEAGDGAATASCQEPGVVYKTHFCQRQVEPVGEGAVGRCGPWVHYTVIRDGVE